jgi:hypothetical protein
MVSFNELFTFVLAMSKQNNVDMSHSEGHSMDVLHFAEDIYRSQLDLFPYLEQQTNVIYTAAVLHDMCDKKYFDPDYALKNIDNFLQNKMNKEEIYYTKEIMKTMSYSTVKKEGYPQLGNYQMAYHVVREADLLSSYNFDRSIIYHLNKGNNLVESYNNALQLFRTRVFNYNIDKLLISDYSQRQSFILTQKAIKRMTSWNNILKKTRFR